MEYKYKGQNRTRKVVNEFVETALILYALFGSLYNLTEKTGHPSADIATGRCQPTALERTIIDSVK